jgi:hypothetical protein
LIFPALASVEAIGERTGESREGKDVFTLEWVRDQSPSVRQPAILGLPDDSPEGVSPAGLVRARAAPFPAAELTVHCIL